MNDTHRRPTEEAEALRREAEASANRFNLKCMGVFSFFAALSAVLNLCGLFHILNIIMLPSMLAAVLLFLLPVGLCFLGREGKEVLYLPWFKLVILDCAFLGIALLCVTLSMHAVICLAIPPLLAAQYRMDRRLFIWMFVIAILLVPLGVYGSFFFGALDRNLLKGVTDLEYVGLSERLTLATPKRMVEIFVHYTLPRLFGMVTIVVLVSGIVRRHNQLLDRQAELARQVREDMERMNAVQSKVIESLATLIESRDEDTGEHVYRTKLFVHLIGDAVKQDAYFRNRLSAEELERIERAAPLHDVGKIAVSDSILLKPGKLTPEEFEMVKCHTTKGSSMVENILADMNERDFLKTAEDMVEYHHERWDGTGYPRGLKGEEIPLSARIMAVADVFDALVSPRVYKEPVPPEEALDIMQAESGTHFDPELMRIVQGMRDTLIYAAKTPMHSAPLGGR